MRAMLVGSARTAEELGRAFPGVRVRVSGGGAAATGSSVAPAGARSAATASTVAAEIPAERQALASVEAQPALVIATPGAEPVAAGQGYGAALLLDGWSLLARPDLRAAEEALRRWANAAALVRPGGRVVIAADAGVPAVQALIRWDARGAAQRELADRLELAFPPASRMAALSGAAAAVADLLDAAELPAGAELIGPTPDDEGHERLLIRVPREAGAALAAALHSAAAARSARKAADPVKIVLDPAHLF
jgi:primosomal protein N' (replication factor Y)